MLLDELQHHPHKARHRSLFQPGAAEMRERKSLYGATIDLFIGNGRDRQCIAPC
ncbi:hypothetical protein FHX15_001785 [Rhizobium sp. BK650]|uniref:hypothetical protein n=1 Tax=Rhizobium sp. BK650 TaxID=2586990 RepID=UPI00161F4487|nr:hypothetical protein [Rhizobium sp. BK650]MBB3656557.1 hypothetical protein [Rhizobium sp. BK650]